MKSHERCLTSRWHVGRKTGEVLRVMDRGTSSINSLLSSILFSIAPTIVDILIAIAYLTATFDVYFVTSNNNNNFESQRLKCRDFFRSINNPSAPRALSFPERLSRRGDQSRHENLLY